MAFSKTALVKRFMGFQNGFRDQIKTAPIVGTVLDFWKDKGKIYSWVK